MRALSLWSMLYLVGRGQPLPRPFAREWGHGAYNL